MSKKYGVILSDTFLSVTGDRSLTLTIGDARFEKAKELLKRRAWQELFDLMDRPAAIARYTKGAVQVYNDQILWNGKQMHGALVNRILDFVSKGLPFEPLVAFLDNLQMNTDERVRNSLYTFLENNQLAITENGSFLAFKLVKEDGRPVYHAGKILLDGEWVDNYQVGNTYTYPRERIVKTDGECSTEGIYVGNRNYWNGCFDEANRYKGDGKMLVVEVFPQDVENVPHADATKIVVSKMKVISEYATVVERVNQPLYTETQPAAVKNQPMRDNRGRFVSSKADDGLGHDFEKAWSVTSLATFVPKRDSKGRFVKKSQPKRDRRGRYTS